MFEMIVKNVCNKPTPNAAQLQVSSYWLCDRPRTEGRNMDVYEADSMLSSRFLAFMLVKKVEKRTKCCS